MQYSLHKIGNTNLNAARISFGACQNLMNQLCLPPDDLPSHQTIRVSEILFRQLEEATDNPIAETSATVS